MQVGLIEAVSEGHKAKFLSLLTSPESPAIIKSMSGQVLRHLGSLQRRGARPGLLPESIADGYCSTQRGKDGK